MEDRRILLVHPSRLLREGLRYILHGAAGALDDVSSAQAFLQADNPIRPDIVIWGVGIPLNSLRLEVAAVRARFARATDPVRHVVLANGLGASFIRQIAMLDIEALLYDDISSEVLLRSIDLVMVGQRMFPVVRRSQHLTTHAEVVPFPGAQRQVQDYSAAAQPREVVLSAREGEILRHLVDGASNKVIARQLQITEATVKVHVRALLRKVARPIAHRSRSGLCITDIGSPAPPKCDCEPPTADRPSPISPASRRPV